MNATVEQVIERHSILEHAPDASPEDVLAAEAAAGDSHIVEATVWRWTVEDLDGPVGYVHNGTAPTREQAIADAHAWAMERAASHAARSDAEAARAAKVESIDLGG